MIIYRSGMPMASDHALSAAQRADVLVEALPYLRQFAGQTLVIKYGGNAMTSPGLREQVAADIALLQYVGMRPVVVHGGGPEIDTLMRQLQREPKFVEGLRVTDDATIDVVEMALNRTNKGLVALLNRHGAQAVGLSGKDADLLIAKKLQSEVVDYGWVGEVQQVNAGILQKLSSDGYIPVICSVATGVQGETYNVNADTVAGLVAASLQASKLLMLSDVEGLFMDLDDPNTLVSEISVNSVSSLLDGGTASAGMIPKLEACLAAVQSGVGAAHLIDGTKPHSLLVELLTDAGVGTMILPESAWRVQANFPLASLEVS